MDKFRPDRFQLDSTYPFDGLLNTKNFRWALEAQNNQKWHVRMQSISNFANLLALGVSKVRTWKPPKPKNRFHGILFEEYQSWEYEYLWDETRRWEQHLIFHMTGNLFTFFLWVCSYLISSLQVTSCVICCAQATKPLFLTHVSPFRPPQNVGNRTPYLPLPR